MDDDEVIGNLLVNYLEAGDITDVTVTTDGEDGWKRLQEGGFDLIILDWKLPRLGGLALFNRIRTQAATQRIPLLVVSGFLQQNDFRLLQEFPCTDLIEKPFTKAKFDSKLESLVKESDWYDQNAVSYTHLTLPTINWV